MNHNHTQHSAPDTFGAHDFKEQNMNRAEETVQTWGACGVEGCTECTPIYNAANSPILGTDNSDQR